MTDSSIMLPELSVFRADDTLITIVPSFDLPEETPFVSSAPIGPFQAGLPTTVPLWTALLLHQRSLCEISPPAWLTATNLSEIIAYEKKEQVLWDNPDRLPHYYFEIAARLTGRKGIIFADDSTSGGGSSQAQVIALLVQDLMELRVDKLRQQFPELLLHNQKTDKNELIVNVNGIGSKELSLLRPFIQQALNDRSFLLGSDQQETKDLGDNETENDENQAEGNSAASVTQKRVPLRRFRR